MIAETRKCRSIIAKNIQAWDATRPSKEPFYEVAKDIGKSLPTLHAWRNEGKISLNNLDVFSEYTGICQGLWMMDERDREQVIKWLENDCSIPKMLKK